MKSLARTLEWWPEIDKQIKTFAKKCYSCQSLRNKPVSIPLHPWGWPATPWHCLHIDFAGRFLGKLFFIIIDAHFKWPKVIPMKVTSAEKTVVVVCDIRIFISILYRYDIGVNIEISIRFSIIFNCVGNVIAWAADIYKYA